MIRVAKAGTRIVVVDETAKVFDRLHWVPGARRMLRKYGERLEAPVALLPEGMQEIEVKNVMNGGLYCLSFRKP